VIFHTFTSITPVRFVSPPPLERRQKGASHFLCGLLGLVVNNIQSETNHFGNSAGETGLLGFPDGALTRIGVPQMDFPCIHAPMIMLKHPEICEVAHILRKFLA
jgi:hypothetical protein